MVHEQISFGFCQPANTILAPFLCSNIQQTSIFHIFHRNNVNHKSHVSYSFSVHFSSLLFYILLQNNNFDGTYFNSHSSVKNVFVLFFFLSLKFLDPIYKLFIRKHTYILTPMSKFIRTSKYAHFSMFFFYAFSVVLTLVFTSYASYANVKLSNNISFLQEDTNNSIFMYIYV